MNERESVPMIRIYADHAATTPLCDAAWQAMMPFLREEFGNPSSLHSWAKTPRKAVVEARQTIAECIGAQSDEIFFTSGGTESDNWALKTLGRKHIVTSAFEHHAVLNSCLAIEAEGGQVDRVSVRKGGFVNPGEVASATRRSDAGLVSIMLANNELGTIQDVQGISRRIDRDKWLMHTDAVQAVGHIPVDVESLGVDLLSASGHKFNGPKGVGFLYVRKAVQGRPEFRPYLNGGQQESGMRAGTENVAAIVGMAAALRWNCEHLDENVNHLDVLKLQFIEDVRSFCPTAHLNVEEGQLPGFVSIAFPGQSAEGLLHILDLRGVAVSSGAACDSKNTQVSHVLSAIKLPKKYASSTLRITFGVENTEDEVEHMVQALVKTVSCR